MQKKGQQNKRNKHGIKTEMYSFNIHSSVITMLAVLHVPPYFCQKECTIESRKFPFRTILKSQILAYQQSTLQSFETEKRQGYLIHISYALKSI